MNVCMISCWYRNDIYSHHCHHLINGLRSERSIFVKLLTSNCNCFSSSQRYSITVNELLNNTCDIIKIPYAPTEPNRAYGKIKYYIVKGLKLNYFFETCRGISFFMHSKGCKLIHFDQVLRSFGFLSFLSMLNLSKIFRKKVIITVHEMDPLQEKYKNLNKYYNKVDKVIVFSGDLKDELQRLGVAKDKIEVVPFAVSIEALKGFHRDQFVFFGGHKLLKGKGFDTLLEALKLLKSKGKRTKVIIYVGHGCSGLEEGKRKASDMQLDDYIDWSDFLFGSRLAEVYQRSLGCLIPFTGGSGRHPVTCAMANATPVIATRQAALPEYLEELGLYINENAPEELADAMIHLMDDKEHVYALGDKLRKRAEEQFSCEVVAQRLVNIYNQVSKEPLNTEY
jgi:glycosyltransferase involved in cell wall biosynthesis